MTLVDWIIFGIVIAALVVLVVLIIRKWSKMRLIDIDAMPKAALRSRKYQIIERRLVRNVGGAFKQVAGVLEPVTERITASSKKVYDRLVHLERKYRHGTHEPQTQEEKETLRQKTAQMLEEGAQLYKDDKYSDAEHVFLDVIRLNPKEVEAYEYLGEIYIAQREFDQAIETLQYAKQLNPNDDRIAYDLGMVYQERGEFERALRFFQEAVEKAENNPRNINGLLQIALETKNVIIAGQMLKRLSEVDPENGKLAEYSEQIEEMKKGKE